MNMKEIIKETIKRRGLSYSDVGKRFDPPCSANNISNTLNKEEPVTPKHVRQFADVLSANKKLWLVQAAKDMLQYKTPEVASLFGLTEHFDGLSTAMFKSPQAQYNANSETPFISYQDLPTTFTTFVLPAPDELPHFGPYMIVCDNSTPKPDKPVIVIDPGPPQIMKYSPDLLKNALCYTIKYPIFMPND